MYFRILLLCFLFCAKFLVSYEIEDKVLILGIGKNIEGSLSNTISSIEKLGSHFLDYQVIIYENNSTDETKKLLKKWAAKNTHVKVVCETISEGKIAKQTRMKIRNRTEILAWARNRVLDIAMESKFDSFKYVVWADLDFTIPWDVDNVVDTILHPEQDWDAVLANGSYDLFALRDPQFPIGFELLGNLYWERLDTIRSQLVLDKKGPWRKVYSAFGGMGIYKRDAIKGCRYSGAITKDLEKMMSSILDAMDPSICFFDDYKNLLKKMKVIDLKQERLSHRKSYPKDLGVRMCNKEGLGKVVWFSCTDNYSMPWTCEHLTFHASMALKGHDKIFINPRIKSNHPLVLELSSQGNSVESAIETCIQDVKKKYGQVDIQIDLKSIQVTTDPKGACKYKINSVVSLTALD